MAISTFSRLGAVSTRNDDPETACRPFSGDKDGMVVGEGAAAFVLETLEHAQARGAQIQAEFAGYIPVTSLKSSIGHAMGAAGAQSAVALVQAMQAQRIAPAINYNEQDPDCDLDYVPNVSRACQVNAGLCNGFGLGGQNASLILKRFTPVDGG